MKPILASLLCLALLSTTGCAYLPPTADAPPTATQQTVSNDLDAVAAAIRKAEDANMTPAEFNMFLQTYVAPLKLVTPYLSGAETAYAVLYEAGNLTITGLESLAARYDS